VSATAEGSPEGSPPESGVDAITPYWRASVPFDITATATDPEGNETVEAVSLWYSYSTDNSSWSKWTLHGVDSEPPWSWEFSASDGHYKFFSMALDNAGNIESTPAQSDAGCAIDTQLPASSVDSIENYWRASTPVAIAATVSDGLGGVESVELWYRTSPDNLTWGEWALFGADDDNSDGWGWDFEGNDGYYEFYSVARDAASNAESPPAAADSRCALDTTAPDAPIDLAATPSSWSNVNYFSVSWTNPSDLSGIAGVYCKLGEAPASDEDGILMMRENVSKIVDIVAPDEGSCPAYVWLVDRAGNTSYANRASAALRFDATPPTTPIPVSPPDAVASEYLDQTLEWTESTDDQSGLASYHLQINLLGSGLVFDNFSVHENSIALTFGVCANYYWRVRAIDNAGNPSSWSGYNTFILENTNCPPTSTIFPIPPLQNSVPFTVTATATDPEGDNIENVSLYYRYSADNLAWEQWELWGVDNESPWSWIVFPPQEGYYQFYTSGVDGGGRIEPVFLPDVGCVVDRTSPGRPMVISPASGLVTNSTTPTFTWSAVSDPSGVTYVLLIDDSPDFSSPAYGESGISGTQRTVELPAGTWYWRVRATDGAGNPGLWSDVSNLIIRTQLLAPELSFSPGATSVETLTISWSSVEGAAGYIVEFAGYQYPTSNPWLTLSGLPEGRYDWRVRAITSEDGVGRSPWSEMQSICVDWTPPSILNFTINSGASETDSTSVTLSLSVSDLGSGVYEMCFSNDGVTWSDWIPYSPLASWTLPSGEGTKAVYAKVRDLAGNESIFVSNLITLTSEVGQESATPTPPGVWTIVLGAVTAGEATPIDISAAGTPFSGLVIVPSAGAESVSVSVQVLAGRPPGVPDPTAGAVYSYVELEVSVSVDNATINFLIPRSWLDQNSVDEDAITLLRWADGAWQELATTRTGEDPTYIHYSATTPGLSIFAIAGKVTGAPGEGSGEGPAAAGAGFPLLPLAAGVATAVGVGLGALWATGRLPFRRPKAPARRVKPSPYKSATAEAYYEALRPKRKKK